MNWALSHNTLNKSYVPILIPLFLLSGRSLSVYVLGHVVFGITASNCISHVHSSRENLTQHKFIETGNNALLSLDNDIHPL